MLLFAILISAFLIAETEPVHVKPLRSVAQIDSLITETFIEFGISPVRVRQQTVEIDSLFSRVIYTTRVPDSFSKTTFHLQLNNNLKPYRIETNGKVTFPEQDLRVHLLTNNKVVRTVELLSATE